MQPSKLLLVSIPFVAIVFLGVGLWLLATATNPSEQFAVLPEVSVTDGQEVLVEPGQSYIAIETPGGDSVLIRDVRMRPEATDMGDNLFALTSLEATTSTPFGITFNATEGTFAIGLEAEPLGQTRRAAEAYFLSLVGISESDACKLDVYIGTVARVNAFYAGQNLGFSFCPGSVPLPE